MKSKNNNQGKMNRNTRSATGADGKLVMTTVWLSPHQMSMLDEIRSYILRNSDGAFRPSRSEIIRLLVERLENSEQKLKQIRTEDALKKEIKGLKGGGKHTNPRHDNRQLKHA